MGIEAGFKYVPFREQQVIPHAETPSPQAVARQRISSHDA